MLEIIFLTDNIIKEAKVVFWDFDGVIKDSIEVKSDAFEEIFIGFGSKLASKVKAHHECNVGMSRFDKLPIYLSWAGIISPSKKLVEEYENRFSLLVVQKVMDSEWVEGVLEYLQNKHTSQQFFLITATPQKEIEYILMQLKIIDYFQKVVGSPIQKKIAIKNILNDYSILTSDAVMIGDSEADFRSSKLNNIEFVLRKTNLNKVLQKKIVCQMVLDFKDLNKKNN